VPSSLHRLVLTFALLLSWPVGALAATPGAAEAATPHSRPADNFGRLQSRAQTCQNNLADAPATACTSVLFEQPSQGLLNIRFLSPGQGGAASAQLNFVGVLAPASTPMACDQGRCRLMGPLTTTVSSMSERSFNDRGLATGLPKAWPAEGRCSVEQRQVRCSAKAPSQESWSAVAEF